MRSTIRKLISPSQNAFAPNRQIGGVDLNLNITKTYDKVEFYRYMGLGR